MVTRFRVCWRRFRMLLKRGPITPRAGWNRSVPPRPSNASAGWRGPFVVAPKLLVGRWVRRTQKWPGRPLRTTGLEAIGLGGTLASMRRRRVVRSWMTLRRRVGPGVGGPVLRLVLSTRQTGWRWSPKQGPTESLRTGIGFRSPTPGTIPRGRGFCPPASDGPCGAVCLRLEC